MDTLIQNIALWIDSSKYILLFIGCIFEGPILMLTSGFLYHLGQFSFVPMYFTLMLGDLTADIFWYALGRFVPQSVIYKYGKFAGITKENIEKSEFYFHKYHQKILIISKLTMGFGFAVVILVVAGIFKVPFKKYLTLNIIGGFIWTLLLVTIGYFFGNIYSSISSQFKIIFAVGILISAILTLKYTNAYLAKQTL